MSIQIGNVCKQGKNLYKQTNNNYGWITHKFPKNLGARRKEAELPELLVGKKCVYLVTK